jgi:Ca-activated chloride channel family protein
VWEKCLKEMEERHSKDGGWAYHGGGTSYGSMTCAGICTLALCRYYLGEKDYLNHPRIKSGLKWLAENFKVNENPKEKSWPLYYLYSVERVGVFGATELIGDHAWYPLGAKHLVGTQDADGSWKSNHENKEIGTGLALLFLTRATAPVKKIKRGGPGALETHALNDYQNFYFILDASGSMREELDGVEKFEIAKQVVEAIVKKLPEGTHAGLRVYGHRFTALDEKSETDSELVIPVQPLNQAQFIATLKSLKCKGKTPITHSLTQAVADLSKVPAEVDIVTILLTDGGESTRGAKPDEAAAKLVASRKGMKLHVVGFDINQDEWKEQLERVAQTGGGKYFHCTKASELQTALTFATVGQVEYVIKDKAGKEVHKGKLGDRVALPEGKYTASITVEGKTAERTFWINTDVTSHLTVKLGLLLKK